MSIRQEHHPKRKLCQPKPRLCIPKPAQQALSQQQQTQEDRSDKLIKQYQQIRDRLTEVLRVFSKEKENQENKLQEMLRQYQISFANKISQKDKVISALQNKIYRMEVDYTNNRNQHKMSNKVREQQEHIWALKSLLKKKYTVEIEMRKGEQATQQVKPRHQKFESYASAESTARDRFESINSETKSNMRSQKNLVNTCSNLIKQQSNPLLIQRLNLQSKKQRRATEFSILSSTKRHSTVDSTQDKTICDYRANPSYISSLDQKNSKKFYDRPDRIVTRTRQISQLVEPDPHKIDKWNRIQEIKNQIISLKKVGEALEEKWTDLNKNRVTVSRQISHIRHISSL